MAKLTINGDIELNGAVLGSAENIVFYSKEQSLTDAQKEQVRSNIGAGTGSLDDAPSDGKQYARRNGEWEIVDISEPAVSMTWTELKSLRDSSSLTTGTYYRITDYTTTTTTSNTQSAGHAFDVIVRADDVNVLNENAYAALHSGDTYFSNSKLEAWELKYCLDNDTDRFDWADTENGKGVIYYMKDEWNNECPYDFKNIQFYRKWNSTKKMWCDNGTTSDGVAAYTFSSTGGSSTTSFTDFSLNINNSVYSNAIKEYISSKKQTLNNNCFFGNNCSVNRFGTNCHNNTFGTNCHRNTFGNKCFENTVGTSCDDNTFGNYCYRNTFGNNCYRNTFGNNCGVNRFGNSCNNNTFGNSCSINTFGNDCQSNTFGNDCQSNTFGNVCYSNTFGNSCNNNTFGNGCYNNTFGNYCYDNTFGDNCDGNTFGTNCYYNTFGTNCDGNTFGDNCHNNTFAGDWWYYNRIDSDFYDNDINTNTEDGNDVCYHHFKSGIYGQTFTVKGREIVVSGETPLIAIEVGINSKGEIVQYCLEDLYKGI